MPVLWLNVDKCYLKTRILLNKKQSETIKIKMGKYSSDSDHEKRSGKRSESHKSSRRRRSNSSDSSDSRSKRDSRNKRSKRTRRSRSRSRDRYSRSKRSDSSSRSSSRVNSSRYRSNRRSRSKSRSRDRRTRLRRSRSRSYIREYTSRPRKRSSSNSNSSSSCDRDKSRKEKRASKKDSSKAAGNGKVDPSPFESGKVEKQETAASTVKEEMPQFDSATLDEINSEGFAPKLFYSDVKPMENIVINLRNQTIKVPEAENKQGEEAPSLFHHNLFASEEARMQKWVKELYIYRQKALQQGARRK